MKPVRNLARADADRLAKTLGHLPAPVASPPFIVLSGLPGSGKSYFCRRLAQQAPFVVLESDVLRRVLFPEPEYSAQESARLFAAIRMLAADLLTGGEPVILDATNLSESQRKLLYDIATNTSGRIILIQVMAPVAVIRQRLEARRQKADPEDRSDADWDIYLKMAASAERIRHRHMVVDTSRDISPAIEKVLRDAGDP